MQDRAIKSKALRFAAARGWFPQLEVDVLPAISISATSEKPVTDIDVMALAPNLYGGFEKILIDCKTKKGESPIARTLWLCGLMQQVGASQGICILKRARVEADHRFYASRYGVLLLTDEEFDEYAIAMGVAADEVVGLVGEIEIWESFFSIPGQYANLRSAVEFARKGYWQSATDSEACRLTIAQLARSASELDPTVASHQAIFGVHVALLLQALTGIVRTIFAGYLKPDNREQLSTALLFLFYGGREGYQFRNRIAKIVRQIEHPDRTPPELAPPNWDGFIQLIRQSLDSPLAIAHAPLIVLETSFTYLGAKTGVRDSLFFGRKLASAQPQAAKLGLLCAEYLQRASQLPRDFADGLTAKLLSIQDPKHTPNAQ